MQHQFPPGCRFYPTDQELITHFLDMKIKNKPIVYNNAVKDFDIYTQDPWVIWEGFGGDYLGDKIDQDQGFFFLTELQKVSDKKKGSNFKRSVPSGCWHGDTAGDLITDYTGKPIGIKKYFIYKSKESTTMGHNGKWKMHEITSLLDPSSNYVLCQLQKNDKGKRKKFELETDAQAAVNRNDGVHVRKRQKFSSATNQQLEVEESGFCKPEENSVCATAEAERPALMLPAYEAPPLQWMAEGPYFDSTIGNSAAITDFTGEGISLDELMNLLDEEPNTCALSENDLKHTIGDSEVIESWKTDIVETDVHSPYASLAVDMGSNHADAVGMSMRLAKASLPA